MKLNRYSFLFVIYVIILLTFSIYSYSQIDLNLTLSANSIYQSFQKQLIQLGYFNRPLSTGIFFILIFLLFTFYFLFLRLVEQEKLTRSNILWLIIGSSMILFFAYPAFSHDIFNYMFDARIVTKYFSNPYFFSAQNFPSDLWVRFMHWTHRTYPYGPTWLLLTLPFSFIGFGKFVLTLFNFKLMFTAFHYGNIYLIYKILKKVFPKGANLGLVFYALNPLILIESIVSPHNEVAMLFFLLLAIYQIFIKNNRLFAVMNLFLSAGIKFVTVILLPLFIFNNFIFYSSSERQRVEKFSSRQARTIYIERWLKLTFLLLIPPLLLQIYYREPYPWYFIILVGITALILYNHYLKFIISGITFGAMLRYIPYLYQGDYSDQVRFQQNVLFIMPIILLSIWLLSYKFKKTMRYNG